MSKCNFFISKLSSSEFTWTFERKIESFLIFSISRIISTQIIHVSVHEKNPEFPCDFFPIVHGFPLGECEGTGFVPGFSVLDVDLGMIWVTRPGFR